MKNRSPLLALLLLTTIVPPAALPAAPPAAVAEHASSDALASHLALPFASGLAGAERAPVFAWVVNAAGVRNIWVSAPDAPAHARTAFQADDGVELSDLVLSPDGARLLFVRGGDAEFPEGRLPNTGSAVETPEQALHIVDVAGTQPEQRIGTGHGAAFSPDGRQVAFTRKGEIWLWNGEARRLATVTGRVEDLIWSPDARTLLFRDNRGDHSFVGLLDLETKAVRYVGATLGHAADPVFSPDGRAVAFIQFRVPPDSQPDSAASFWSLRVVDLASGAVRTPWTAPAGDGGRNYGTRGRNLFWTASGHLLFPWERTGWLHVYAVPAAGDSAARDLTPNANEVENFVPTPDGRSVVYSANAGSLDTRQLWRTSISGGQTTRLTRDDQFVFFPVFGGTQLAATVSDAQRPSHMLLVDGMKPLGPVPVAKDYAKPETVVFTAPDGLQVHGQLFHGQGKGKRPALVFVHGGPRRQMLPGFHPMQYYSNAYVRNQAFAAQGYTVLSVNYRSGTNYGHDFREAPHKGRDGASEYQDVLAAGQWLARRGDVDPNRIGIWGGSWGGYLTALALARNSDLFAAGADFHGVHTLLRAPGKSLSPDDDAKARQVQWDSSPIAAIDRWRSPVLVVHGDDDSNVEYDQSLLLVRELTARNVDFEELSLPNERHEFFRYADWLAAYRATDSFFARTLMRRPAKADTPTPRP